MVSGFIVHVDESDFQYEVLQYSARVPVVVDFWATWCVPCRVLGPKLEALAREAEGRFRLAKVNVDENPRLAKQYKVRSIPAVKAYVDGFVVSEFAGVLGDDNLRDFIKRLAPTPGDLLLSKGLNLIKLGEISDAEEAFREFLSLQSNNPGALLGLIRVLLMQGKGQESKLLLRNFPASSEYKTAQQLEPVAEAFTEPGSPNDGAEDTMEAAFRNSIRLAKRGNVFAALDGFFGILKKDRHYRKDQVRDICVGLLTMLGDDHPEVRQYRQELASVLF